MEFTAQIMSIIFTPILLLIIFFYQKNKNKLLIDTIHTSKDHAAQQAQAIDAQKKIADSATELAKVFDPAKFESIIRKEIELDYNKILKEKDDKLTSHQHKMNFIEDLTIEKYILPLANELFNQLVWKNDQEREDALVNIPGHLSVKIMERLNDYDEMIKIERIKALEQAENKRQKQK